jgi:uncharacterized protein (DUF1800 family)
VQAGYAALTASLCVVMAVPPAIFAAEPVDGPKAAIPTESHLAPLTHQEKALHALNRLTFGPRPGDEAMVARMGLEAWFQQQLHPETMDDAAFTAELAKFPAMQLTQAELLQRFPGPQEIRQMVQRRAALPADPVEHAIYADAIASYEEQRKKVEAGQAPVAGVGDGMMAGDSMAGQAYPTLSQKARKDGPPSSVAGQTRPTRDGETVTDGAPGSVAGQMKPTRDGGTVTDGAPGLGKGKAKRAAEGEMDQADVEAVLALPPTQRMDRLVGMSPQEMMSFRNALKQNERLRLMQGLTPAQMEIVAAMQAPGRVVGAEVLETRLLRDVSSQRQLQAVMTDFWLNHFSVYVRKNQNEVYYLPAYQNDVVLPNALGNFEQLLVATAKSPAMLMYLDNWESIGPDSLAATRVKQIQKARPDGKIVQALPKGINENYARELMELHTLGVGGGYTQKDVIEVAKCFTGWTINRPYQGAGQMQRGFKRAGFGGGQGMQQDAGMQEAGAQGEFIFEPNRHEGGDKVVLGHTIHEGGMNEGLEVLHILATSPATAKFVSTKLAVRFVSDTPPPALVDKMAATFLKTDGDIKAVLTTMFHAPEFWSPEVYRAKVKTPLEFMVSALRASDATVNNPLPLVQAMEKLGMPIYGMQTPNGYSWKADEWVSSNALVSRMNFALVLSGGRVPGVRTDWAPLLGGETVSAEVPTAATEKRLEAVILGQPASARTRDTVMAQFANGSAVMMAEANFNGQKTADEDEADGGAGMLKRAGYGRRGGGGFQAGPATPLDTMAGLLLGSPEFQRR